MKFKALLAGTALAFGLAAGAQAGEFDGVTVNILTQTGPAISGPMQKRAPDFEKLTGAKINVITVPYSDLYQKLLTDWTSGTNSVDAGVFAPQWMVDYVTPGLIEDLTDRVAADKALESDDIAPFFREFSQKFNGKTYMLTLDGDFQIAYYRTDVAKELGLKPLARFVSFAVGAVPPEIMGIGPVVAIPKALKRAGLTINDIDIVELNEAFAAQALPVIRETGMDMDKVNVNGGAIALGHPLGASGGKLTVQILNEMKRRNARYGMVTMCVGGGQGAAIIYENMA